GRRLACDNLALAERGSPDSRGPGIARLFAHEFTRCLQRTDSLSLPGIVHTLWRHSEVVARLPLVSLHGREVKVIHLKSRYLAVPIWCGKGSYSVCGFEQARKQKLLRCEHEGFPVISA